MLVRSSIKCSFPEALINVLERNIEISCYSGKACKDHCSPRDPKLGVSKWINWVRQGPAFKEWNKQKVSTRKMSKGSFSLKCKVDVYYSLRSKM